MESDRLQLDRVSKHLNDKLYPLLSLEKKVAVKSSWDGTLAMLESLPHRLPSFPLMKIAELPRQPPAVTGIDFSSVPIQFQQLAKESDIPELEGEVFLTDAERRKDEVLVGQDVVVYTESREDRYII